MTAKDEVNNSYVFLIKKKVQDFLNKNVMTIKKQARVNIENRCLSFLLNGRSNLKFF